MSEGIVFFERVPGCLKSRISTSTGALNRSEMRKYHAGRVDVRFLGVQTSPQVSCADIE